MSLTEKSARPASPGREFARSEAANLPGEFLALLQQIGSPELSNLSPDGLNPSGDFLQTYLARLLMPLELPAIAEACGHSMRGELRELIAQDQRLSAEIALTPFAAASQRTGRLQLARLRPLRDERIVQRYLAAVQAGESYGWHTIVYGMTLALYSLPLRQGLLHYAQETLASLGSSFAGLDAPTHLDSLMEQVPVAVESALARY